MSWSVANVLDARFIDAAYKELNTVGFAPTPLMQMFGSMARPTFGDTVEVSIFASQRVPAPTNNIGAKSNQLGETGVYKKYFTPIHSFNHMALSQHALMYLEMEDNPAVQQLGRDEITRQLEQFKIRHAILREVALHKAFFEGVIYRNAGGDITASTSTGPDINLGVSSTHQSQLTPSGGSAIIGTAWDNAAATILTDLDEIKTQAAVEGKPEPKHIFAPMAAKKWIRTNTEMKAYFQTAKIADVDKVLRGDMYPDLGGYTWHFYDGVYIDSTGTSRHLVPQDKVCITPEPGPWFRAFDSSFRIPVSNDIRGADVGSIAGNGQVVYGDFAYCREKDDPATMLVYGGTTFLYAFADPDAIWQADVAT